MKNIALVLSYDGTNFNGWQIQKNGPSIQESMEDAIFHLLKQKVHVSGVGRTDSGVHARRYVANFHADCTIPMDRLPYALNSFLPEDIAVSGAVEVPENFDGALQLHQKGIRLLSVPFHPAGPVPRAVRISVQLSAGYYKNAGRRTVFCRQAGLCIREKSGYTGQEHGSYYFLVRGGAGG